MRRELLRGSCRAMVGLVLAGAVSSATAQTDTLYITDGDSSRLAIVQGGVLQSIATTHNKAYSIAVRGSIWLGDYNGTQADAIEYDLNGVPTGNAVPYRPVFAVDGAVNGNINYELGNAFSSLATVYAADADWQNKAAIFNVSGTQLTGITFDSLNGTLWISDQNTIYEYDLIGNVLSSFSHTGNRGCLAYEPSTDTLWHVTNNSDVIMQWSKAGTLLNTVNVAGLSSNNWGAEFSAGPGMSCLTLTVDPLVAGQAATWSVSGATAGEQVAIVYGFGPGSTVLNGFAGYCASFGIQGVNQNRVICRKLADGGGNVACTKQIPGGVQGRRILSQASERNTCPNECMSNLDDQVVG